MTVPEMSCALPTCTDARRCMRHMQSGLVKRCCEGAHQKKKWHGKVSVGTRHWRHATLPRFRQRWEAVGTRMIGEGSVRRHLERAVTGVVEGASCQTETTPWAREEVKLCRLPSQRGVQHIPTPDWTARLHSRPVSSASRDRPESPPSPTPTTLRGPLPRARSRRA